MAGSVEGYSNQGLEQLVEVLGRFARPQHPEKSLAELQRLLEDVQNAEPRPERTTRKRAVKTEQRVGDDRISLLLSHYAQGGSAQAVGREFEVSAATVMRLVRKHGLEINSRLPSPEVVAEAAELYASGFTVRELADQFGTSKPTMLRQLKKVGTVMRPAKPRGPRARPHEADLASE